MAEDSSSSAHNATTAMAPNSSMPSETIEEAEADGDQCFMVCENNHTELLGQWDTGDMDGDAQEEISTTATEPEFRLRFLTNPNGAWIGAMAKAFEQEQNGLVSIELVEVEFSQLFPDIINEAQSQTGLYDGFLTPPSVAGSVVVYDGWKDLTPFIQESAERVKDWSDILLGYRQYVAQYEGKIIMYPLDGDILSLYYRKDVLQAFNLTVPRTWEEYGEVAAAVHGKMYQNQTLVGSCVGRVPDCAGSYWANLVLSSMTQYQGQWSGHLFDPQTMQPLTGEAIETALEWMETQVLYGPDDEFDKCVGVNMDDMNEGTCVLTYMWGNSFKIYMADSGDGSKSKLKGNFGVAPTPGSTKVLDRSTNQLVPCNEDRCKHGRWYEDIGWVNEAPYLAFGGWACAVNNYAADERNQRLAAEFCAFASSREGSIQYVIPNASGADSFNGMDPFRESHLNLDLYEQQGYERDTAEEFIQTIREGIDSKNVVTDIRFPTANAINAVLDREFLEYLNQTKHGIIAPEDRTAVRAEISQRITLEWQQIINLHDQEGARTAQYTVLESYQRLRDVYANNIDLNQLGNVRWFGVALAAIAMVCAVAFATWTIAYKETRVVRASQPIFLVMVCFGAWILASSIVLMGIDDEIASQEACGKVCMAIPWFVATGWVIVFSALHSKLQRVNLVFKNARRFKRLAVKERDVLVVFGALFALNFVLLLIWTILEPVEWERSLKGELESYGSCNWHLDSTVSKVLVSLLGCVNGLALILANVEAYKARKVSTEYGESKYIGMAMGSILQALLVAVPLFILVDENPSARFFVQASFMFIVAMSILLLIFVPKVRAWMQGPAKRSSFRSSSTTEGLAFRVINTDVFAPDADERLKEHKRKLAYLTSLLKEEGVNVDELYQRAGLLPENSVDVSTPFHVSTPSPSGASGRDSVEFHGRSTRSVGIEKPKPKLRSGSVEC